MIKKVRLKIAANYETEFVRFFRTNANREILYRFYAAIVYIKIFQKKKKIGFRNAHEQIVAHD